MGRDARISRPGLIYHIINRGNNKQTVFVQEEDYREYLNTIQRYKKKYGFKLFAYCLMSNHVHLLIKLGEEGSISKIMQSITVAHTRRFNDKYKQCGHVWQGRFRSPIVSEDNYFLTAMRYIEQNPIRANIVKNPEDYRWSSYRLNVRKQESELIDRQTNEAFNSLGKTFEERVFEYKKIVEIQLPPAELELIQKSSSKGIPFISEEFKQKMKFIVPVVKRGRPKKINP